MDRDNILDKQRGALQPGNDPRAYNHAREDGTPTIQTGGSVLLLGSFGNLDLGLYKWVVVSLGVVKRGVAQDRVYKRGCSKGML